MEVLHYPEPCPTLPGGTVVTIGAYDGVHLGHRAVIDQVPRAGRRPGTSTRRSSPSTAIPPRSSARRPRPLLLTDLDQKLELLAADRGRPTPSSSTSTRSGPQEPAEDFVHEVLVDGLGRRSVVVGEDFHFGHRRQGNVALLARWAASSAST